MKVSLTFSLAVHLQDLRRRLGCRSRKSSSFRARSRPTRLLRSFVAPRCCRVSHQCLVVRPRRLGLRCTSWISARHNVSLVENNSAKMKNESRKVCTHLNTVLNQRPIPNFNFLRRTPNLLSLGVKFLLPPVYDLFDRFASQR